MGIFSPVINWCGGAEWVTLNIINALKEKGHQVILLSDKLINQKKFEKIFKKTINLDQQIVFPFRFFSTSDFRNVYTDSLRSLILKSKCDFLLDTYSNGVLLGTDAVYIHHPLLKQAQSQLPNMLNRLYLFPYKQFLNFRRKRTDNKLIFANSKFTAKAIKGEIGKEPHILYPPVSNNFIQKNEINYYNERSNNVVIVSRICRSKNLEIIPYIARLTGNDISFKIIGLLDSINEYNALMKLIRDLNVSDRVVILPNVKKQQLRKIMLNSKVFLHTTINEHFGISIIDAMALGCIPVVHNSGGPREFVHKKFRYNTIEEAAEKINRTKTFWSQKQALKISKETERFSEINFSNRFIKIFTSYVQKNFNI